MSLLPTATPKAALGYVEGYVKQHAAALERGDAVKLVGIRGYYRDSMGKAGVNDRGLYDDALFIVSPTHFSTWNGNTDPSIHRPGIASLLPGVHRYKRGRHGISRGPGYPAFRPATKDEALPVKRDGKTGLSLGIAINIHRGGNTTTSSEGCQTIPPAQWPAFYAALDSELTRHGQRTFPYILIENQAAL